MKNTDLTLNMLNKQINNCENIVIYFEGSHLEFYQVLHNLCMAVNDCLLKQSMQNKGILTGMCNQSAA